MRSNNTNKAITNLAMPERQIPVLIDASPENAEGFVTSGAWSEKSATSVRRLQPSFVDGLRSPRKRREIEKEHGAISTAEWTRLREMIVLIDRLNAGDWSPVISTNAAEKLKPMAALLNTKSKGWLLVERGPDKIVFKSASDDEQVFEIAFGEPTMKNLVSGQRVSTTALRSKSLASRDSSPPVWSAAVHGTYKTAVFALSEAFTAGLSKTRFVVWWSDVGKKLVPGLYCPDIVTALYALAMWSNGTAGGWAICQKCGEDFPRSRAKQLYCSHKCQVAAAMKRMRSNRKRQAEMESKATTKAKKHKGRK
jgi:hypothetical protein